MKVPWRYQEHIDLEYFNQLDGELPQAELHERDRQIYLHQVKPQLTTDPASPRLLMAAWLAARRAEASQPLPGNYAAEALRLIQLLLLGSGALLGGAAGLAFFSYAGTTPVNVLHFLAFFVLAQILMMLLLLSKGAIQIILRRPPLPIARTMISGLVNRAVSFLVRQLTASLAAEHRHAFAALFGRAKGIAALYGKGFFWLLCQLNQLFAIAFNLGLLATTFAKITITDIAFGWQSTIQFSTDSLHRLVQLIALPWAWLLPPATSHPSLAQIEGSRIILKDGLARLATGDLVSWWPFLLLAILTYGLLPRLLLLIFFIYREKIEADDRTFTTAAASSIQRRMLTPSVSAQARPESDEQRNQTDPIGPEQQEPNSADSPLLIPLLMLVPDEIHEQVAARQLAEICRADGYQLVGILPFLIDYRSDELLLAELAKDVPESTAIGLLMEAWMPPITGFLGFIKKLRQATGITRPILLRLLGKPAGANPLTPVQDPIMLKVWRQKTAALADPYLQIAPLVEEKG